MVDEWAWSLTDRGRGDVEAGRTAAVPVTGFSVFIKLAKEQIQNDEGLVDLM